MKKSKMGSAVVGLRNFVFCPMINEENETYGSVIQFGEAIKLKVSPSTSDESLYTDNGLSETAGGVNSGTVDADIKDLVEEVEAIIYGHAYDSAKGGIIKKTTDVAPYGAFGWIVDYNNGSSKYCWLTKTRFNESEDEVETQGETKKLQTKSTISGKFTARKRDNVFVHSVLTTDPTFTKDKQEHYFDAPYELPTAIAVTSVALGKSTTTLAVGGEETLVVTLTPSTATNQDVTWFSTDTSKVTVTQEGVITGAAAGTAVVAVVTNDGNKTASCEVTVS